MGVVLWSVVRLASVALALAIAVAAGAQTTPSGGGRIDNLKVLSNHIDDVTTAENILRSFVKPGMNDEQRAKALWTAAVKYRHQTVPPNEYLSDEWEAHDPVKLFNVYGYCMCCCASSIVEALNRLDGREARGRILNGHSVPEVQYGGEWHMFDCSLITLFPKPDNGDIASVDDISAAVKGWYKDHPEYHGNDARIDDLMRSDGWTGWKSHGPALLANCPYYTLGWLPARTHGWDATMHEYDRSAEVYEYGYQLGYRALFSLRPGESIERDAANRGLHVNMDKDPKWDGLADQTGQGDLLYVKDFLPGYTGGVVGNGYHRYNPDLASGGLALGADAYDNLASGGQPALYAKAPGRAGIAVIQMACPYVYLGGRIAVRAYRKSAADQVSLSLSTNNGRTYEPVWSDGALGASEAKIELGGRVLRRYAYWLKVEIRSAEPRGAGLEALSIENDIQHAPRTVPWLATGSNTITVASDGGNSTATRTVSCRISPDAAFKKNETTATMGAQFDNLDVKDGGCWWKGGTGSMTVPIETPGDMVDLRFGAHVRARDGQDLVKLLLSFDGGSTWTEAARIAGPTAATTRYFRYDTPPAGARKALLRFELTGRNTVGIFSFRLDADYRDPLASRAFRPFTVTHRWKEGGVEKLHTETVPRLPYTYTIQADTDPEMVGVTYAMVGK